jgi:ParB family transcriptional regulator, chromosome partitioning protein
MELINEIQRLKAQGYNHSEIGRKLDIDRQTIIGLIALKKSCEERLLEAALNGKIPLSVAIEIAKTDGIETQRALLKAYEKKQLNHASIRDIKKLMEQRRFMGKQRGSEPLSRERRWHARQGRIIFRSHHAGSGGRD